MGFFGGGGDDSARQENDLIEKQISDNNAEIERQTQALALDKIRIVKSQGAQQWGATTPASSPPQASPNTELGMK